MSSFPGETVKPAVPVTYRDIDAERERRGPRLPTNGAHYALCSGFDCPCYLEGAGVAAYNHCSGYGVVPTGPGGTEVTCMRCGGSGTAHLPDGDASR